jgi:RimJ/RimL family protein N-acetyltransferase
MFDVDPAGDLAAVNAPDADPPPRLFLARGRDTHLIAFRTHVAESARNACRRSAELLPPWTGGPTDPRLFEPLRAALGRDEPIEDEDCGPAFRFAKRVDLPHEATAELIDEQSAHLLDEHFPYTRAVLEQRAPVVGVVVDGSVVAACYAARRRPDAAEAGLATVEQYRRRGLAGLVVAAWRDAVEESGRQPLYSTSWDNLASRAVARKLGLVPYAETLSVR